MMAVKYTLTAVDAKETELFYTSREPEHDLETGCIGHMRADFARSGMTFRHTWVDHCIPLKTQVFQNEFREIVDYLQKNGILKNRAAMSEYCSKRRYAKIFTGRDNEYGFKITTDDHVYYLRCNTMSNEYNMYCYAYERDRLEKCDLLFIKPEQISGITDELQSTLENAAKYIVETSARDTSSGNYIMYPDDIPSDIVLPHLYKKHLSDIVEIMREYDAIAEIEICSDSNLLDIIIYLDYCPNFEPSQEELANFPSDRRILNPLKTKRIPESDKPSPMIPTPRQTLMERLAENKEKAARQGQADTHSTKKREVTI